MHENRVNVAELFHHAIHHQELWSSESVCVQLYMIVVKLWANIMLHWQTSNRPTCNSKHETLNRIGLMLGQYRRRWANIRLPLDQYLVSRVTTPT